MLNRVPSRLPDEIETVVSRVVGCLITVHRSLGAGLLESVYGKAIAIELETAAILFERARRNSLSDTAESNSLFTGSISL